MVHTSVSRKPVFLSVAIAAVLALLVGGLAARRRRTAAQPVVA